jgi:hypothetical protein
VARQIADTTDANAPTDSAPDSPAAIRSALDTVPSDYAAELRYRRLVAWIACLLAGLLLIGAVVGGYVHRDRVAALERDLAATRAVADERADTIRDLRAELARERQQRAADGYDGE